MPGVILVVEDNKMNLDLVRDVLSLAGFEVLAAEDVPRAFSILEKSKVDLILMDIQLPGISGLDATRKLKGNPETAGIPVVAVTANAMKGERERAMEAGCSGFITKPIDVRTFTDDIRKYLP